MNNEVKDKYTQMLEEAKKEGSGCSPVYIEHLEKAASGSEVFGLHKEKVYERINFSSSYIPYLTSWEKVEKYETAMKQALVELKSSDYKKAEETLKNALGGVTNG